LVLPSAPTKKKKRRKKWLTSPRVYRNYEKEEGPRTPSFVCRPLIKQNQGKKKKKGEGA